MSLKAVTWAFEQEIPPNEKIVLLALADYADEQGSSYPSMLTICRKASMSESTVRRMLTKLEERGLLVREERRTTGGAQQSNIYRIVRNPPVNLTPPSPPVTADSPPLSRLEPITSTEPNNNKRARKGVAIPLPEDWTPTEEHKAMAMARGLDVEEQALAFRFHAEANDRRQVVWNSAFSQWIMNARPNRSYVPTTRSGSPVPAAPKYPDAPPIDDDWQPYFPPPLEN